MVVIVPIVMMMAMHVGSRYTDAKRECNELDQHMDQKFWIHCSSKRPYQQTVMGSKRYKVWNNVGDNRQDLDGGSVRMCCCIKLDE